MLVPVTFLGTTFSRVILRWVSSDTEQYPKSIPWAGIDLATAIIELVIGPSNPPFSLLALVFIYILFI
jgi:hypothetical protein